MANHPNRNAQLYNILSQLGRGDGVPLARWLIDDAPMPDTTEARYLARLRAEPAIGCIEAMRSIYAAARACLAGV